MSLMRSTVILLDDGTVETPGIDWDIGSRRLRVVKRTTEFLVLYKPGGSGWAGRGTRKYWAAQYIVYRVVGEKANGIFAVEDAVMFDARPPHDAKKKPPQG